MHPLQGCTRAVVESRRRGSASLSNTQPSAQPSQSDGVLHQARFAAFPVILIASFLLFSSTFYILLFFYLRVPVSEQVLGAAATSEPPSVMVPIGVLKRHPSTSEGSLSRQENKSVIFSDGIRPGGDLAELDGGSEHRTLGKRPGKGKPRRLKGKAVAQGTLGGVCTSKLPPEGLPMVSGKRILNNYS